MPQYVDRAGAYRGEVIDYGLKEHKKEGSVSYSLNVVVALHEFWDAPNEQWLDWRESDLVANGYLNVVQKNGKWNESQVTTIMEHGGWDGSFASLYDQTWKPTPCQFDVKWNDFGDGSYRVEWFAAHDRVPGGLGNCDAKMAQDLDTRLRSSLKAITGNVKRAESKPESKVAAPLSNPAADRPDDDIPF